MVNRSEPIKCLNNEQQSMYKNSGNNIQVQIKCMRYINSKKMQEVSFEFYLSILLFRF